MLYFHIALKEIKELFRDKKNFVLNILFPLLMIIIIAGIAAFAQSTVKNKDTKLTVAVNTDTLRKQLEHLPSAYTVVKKSKNEMIDGVKSNKLKLGVVWDDDKQSLVFIENKDSRADPYFQIMKDNILRAFQISMTPNLNLKTVQTTTLDVEKNYSSIVLKTIAVICSYVIMLLVMRLNNSNAYYLTTKEKSSGTLEILLISPIRNIEIVIGKWIANLFSCYFITVVIFFPLYAGFTLLFQVVLKLNLNLLSKIPILALDLLGFVTVFSLFQLLLGFRSESSKQAQLFLVYVPWILFLPLTITFATDLRSLNFYNTAIYWIDFIPIVNFYDLLQMSILSIFNLKKMLLISATNIFVVLIFISNLVKIFNNEKILFFKD